MNITQLYKLQEDHTAFDVNENSVRTLPTRFTNPNCIDN